MAAGISRSRDAMRSALASGNPSERDPIETLLVEYLHALGLGRDDALGAEGTEFAIDNFARSACCISESLLRDVGNGSSIMGWEGDLSEVESDTRCGRKRGSFLERIKRTGCPRRDVFRDQPWKIGATPGHGADVVHCQEVDRGVNDSLGAPRAAATEQWGQSDQIALPAVTDGQLLPIGPREIQADDAGANECDPRWRARAKDEIAGEDVHGFADTLEQFLPDRAPTVLDVFDQSASRIALD
jgi:hypothetical protein